MSGYAASARIVRASPRLIQHEAVVAGVDWRPIETDPVVLEDGRAVWSEPAIPMAERLDRFRERWAQLTFYLTDPNSWR